MDIERPLSAGNSTEALNQADDDDDFGQRKLIHNISDSVISPFSEHKQSKKRKPERIKGPHKSRESLGRPTILEVEIMNQQQDSFESRCHLSQLSIIIVTLTDEDVVDFNAVPLNARLSTKAAYDKCGAAKNIKRRKASTKRSLFLHTDENLKYGTSTVDPSATVVS